jgi:predicted nucleic acid-binding protein
LAPRVALDTNVLVYAEGISRAPGDAAKIALSRRLVRALNLGGERWIAATQVFGELHNVLVRRAALSPFEASVRVRRLTPFVPEVGTLPDVFDLALGIAAAHNLQIFDAIILAAAAQARCDLLLSEDLHEGFVWRGVTVTNPFGPSPDLRLTALLASGP